MDLLTANEFAEETSNSDGFKVGLKCFIFHKESIMIDAADQKNQYEE